MYVVQQNQYMWLPTLSLDWVLQIDKRMNVHMISRLPPVLEAGGLTTYLYNKQNGRHLR